MTNVGMKMLSASLRNREAYMMLKEHADMEGASPDIAWLLSVVGKFYDNDPEAEAVDKEILQEQVKHKFASESKSEPLLDLIEEAFGCSFSIPNYLDLCLESKRTAIGNRLASALSASDKDDGRIADLFSQYQGLSVEEAGVEEVEVLHNVSVEDSINNVFNKEGRIFLAPKVLNDECGGALPGNHIIIFAPPNAGKTATACTLMAGFAWYNLPGIYFTNEEPAQSTMARLQCCITGMTKDEMEAEPEKAAQLLARRGYENIRMINIHGSNTPATVEKYVKKYGAKWFIMDQLRHLRVKADGRTNQLEAAATEMREVGGRTGALAISITQGNASCYSKLVLTMEDIDGSKIGIPGSADLIIGIGITDDYEQQGLRMFSLAKNKFNGKHTHFPVRINVQTSKMEGT